MGGNGEETWEPIHGMIKNGPLEMAQSAFKKSYQTLMVGNGLRSTIGQNFMKVWLKKS